MSSPGASELMRSLGVLVDGPAVWGAAVGGRGPGVFVVELPNPPDAAPIDDDAVRRWLARVAELTVDGEQPSVRELARRLAAFWLPGEPILYVGRSRRSVAGRVAAMYATQLGDSSPYSGGYWLKALSALGQLRIWWAATDAHEEYEDELLAQVAGRQTEEATAGLLDSSVVLPFANLAATSGQGKRHGIENGLRQAAEPLATPSAKAAPPARRRAAGATRTTGGAAPRKAPTRAAKPTRAAAAPTYLSATGVADLQAELDELRNNVRPVVIERVKTARELGDLRENADYEAARNEQSFLEGRIQALEALLRSAVVVDAAAGDVVTVGSSVVVEIDGETTIWQVVGSSEADPAAGRISYASPVGQALLGRRAGDEVVAQLPRGPLQVKLREVR